MRAEHAAGQGTCGPKVRGSAAADGRGGAHSGTGDLCGLQTGTCGEIKAHSGTGDLDGNLGNAVWCD